MHIWIIHLGYGLSKSNTIIIYIFIRFLGYLKTLSKFSFSNIHPNKYPQNSDSNTEQIQIFEHPFTPLRKDEVHRREYVDDVINVKRDVLSNETSILQMFITINQLC